MALAGGEWGNTMQNNLRLGFALLLSATLACGGLSIGGSDATVTPLPSHTSPPATNVIPPTNTARPTSPPTATNAPTQTAPPPTPGPLELEDDFSSDLGIWDCELCEISNGTMTMGPYPVSGAGLQHVAYCDACGVVTTYSMSVDVTFKEGESDRGYGFMARETESYMLVYEITPWQTVGFWKADYEKREWEFINGQFSGTVRPGKQTNRIAIEVAENSSGRVDISLIVNGRTPLVIFNQPAEPGWVGLTLFGHAMGVTFDNFVFETEETPMYPEGTDGEGSALFDPSVGS